MPFPKLGPVELVQYVTKEFHLTFGSATTLSADFQDYVNQSTIRNDANRPSPAELLKHPFIVRVESSQVDMMAIVAQLQAAAGATGSGSSAKK